MNTKFCLSLLTLTSVVVSSHPAIWQANAIAQTYQPTNRTPVADNTLGTQVSGNGNNFNITGGVNKGQTLFHSFTDFSVPTNGQANFTNPVGNRDIITRVTGNVFSDINGTVNTNGANFFLINPNGIVFGTDAQLNVGKAFVGSTANSIDLVDAGGRTITFGTNDNGDAPLLSVAPNVLFDVSRLNMPGGNGAISNFGTLQTNNPNQYIGLIGGNVTMNGGQINALGGRVELGGLSAFGTIALGGDINNLQVQFPTNVARGDVSFTNGSRVNVAGSGGGDITISARNLQILGGSVVRGGIETGLGTPEAVAGDIKLNATGEIAVVVSGSAIANNVNLNSKGQDGNIAINASSLLLRDGAQLAASTSGIGNAGNVTVTADAVSLINASIFSDVNAGGVGKGGNITIDAGTLSLQNSAQLITIVRGASDTQPAGKGDAGNVNLKVSGAVDITGIKDGFSSGIRSLVNTGTVGNGGNITIDAGSFLLRDGAELTTSTFGTGDAGNVTVTAKDAVSFAGNSNIFSTVEAGGVGKGGNITIDAGSFSLKDGAQLLTVTRKASDTQPAGKGNAGNVNVKVSGAVDIAGSKDGLPSAIFSLVDTGTVGKGGNITIDAGSFSLRDGAKIESSTSGTGNAGNIGIKAKGDITLAGTATFVNNQPTNISKSAIISSSLGVGDAGKISIDNPSGKLSLSFSNIQATIGDAENKNATGSGRGISINARKLEIKNNSFIVSELFGKGQAGNIDIKTTGDITISGNNKEPLKVTPFNLSAISSTTRGIGDGGKISIETPSKLSLDSTGFLASGTDKDAQGKSQGIKINVGELILTDFGGIVSDTLGKNPGGDIEIVVKGAVNIKKSTIQASSEKVTSTLTVPGGNDIPVNATGEGKAGNISISSDRLNIDGGIIGSISSSDSGGNITVTVRDLLLLRNDGNISTTSGLDSTGGNGGNIIINSPLIVALPAGNGGGNDITANAFTGNGGKVNITSQGLFGIQFRPKSSPLTNDITASSTFGQNGSVNISTPGTDPGRDSTELPNTTTDASNQISQVCSANNRQNKLTVTGRGGLPPNANDPLTSDVVWQDARATSSQPAASNTTSNPVKLAPPAVGWVFDGKGKVTLIAAGSQGQTTTGKVVCPQEVK